MKGITKLFAVVSIILGIFIMSVLVSQNVFASQPNNNKITAISYNSTISQIDSNINDATNCYDGQPPYPGTTATSSELMAYCPSGPCTSTNYSYFNFTGISGTLDGDVYVNVQSTLTVINLWTGTGNRKFQCYNGATWIDLISLGFGSSANTVAFPSTCILNDANGKLPMRASVSVDSSISGVGWVSLTIQDIFLNYTNSTCNSCDSCEAAITAASPGDTITLTTDVSVGIDSCIFNPNNFNHITFDCDGHKMTSGNIMFYMDGKHNNTIKNCISTSGTNAGVYLLGASENNTFENNSFINAVTGIQLDGTASFNIFTNNNLSSNTDGVVFGGMSGPFVSNEFRNNNVSSNSNTGFFLSGISNNNIIENNNILSNSGYGIKLVSGGEFEFINNNIRLNGNGILINTVNSNNVTNNTINSNGAYGVELISSNHNIFNNNSIMNNNIDVKDVGSVTADNIFTNLNVNGTILNFTGNEFTIKEVKDNEYPVKADNITHTYINATNLSTNSWVYMNITYLPADIVGYVEADLVMWKWNDTDGWTLLPATVDTVGNYIHYNTTTFSDFALFGGGSSTSNCTYTGGNWYIGVLEDCIVADQTLNVTGNLSIYGNLKLSNIDLIFNASTNSSNITSYLGSIFIIANQSNLTTNQTDEYFGFINYGTLQLNDSYVSYVHNDDFDGIQIDSNYNVVKNNTITNIMGNGIFSSGNMGNGHNNTITNNTITTTEASCISAGNVDNNTIESNAVSFCGQYGIHSINTYSTSLTTPTYIRYNNITNTSDDGIFVGVLGTGTYNYKIDNNKISNVTNSSGLGIHLNEVRNSTINNNIIQNNIPYGIYSEVSIINIKVYNIFENNTITTIENALFTNGGFNEIVNNNTISTTNNGQGINVYGNNDTITNNTISNVTIGIVLSDFSDMQAQDNKITNCTMYGYVLDDTHNASIKNSNITNVEYNSMRFGVVGGNTDSIFQNINLDNNMNISGKYNISNPTGISYLYINKTYDVSITRNVTGYLNISNYTQSGIATHWMQMNISYNETLVSSLGYDEGGLEMWRYDGSLWSELSSDNESTQNYISYNITNFSTFTLRGDTHSPQYSGLTRFPTDGTVNSGGTTTVQINATWIDNTAISDVILEFAGSNYSYLEADLVKSGNVYYQSLSGLGVGSYSYKWYSNDSSNNWNTSTSATFTVALSSSDTPIGPVTPVETCEPACTAGNTCEGTTCVPIIPTCTDDDDCNPGWTCIAGTCVSPDEPECTESIPCQTGYECILESCSLIPDESCTVNSDCTEEGFICIDNICTESTPCITDNDCLSGEICTDGLCVLRPGHVCCRRPAMSIRPPRPRLPTIFSSGGGGYTISSLAYTYQWSLLADCMDTNEVAVSDSFCTAVIDCPEGQYWTGTRCASIIFGDQSSGGGGDDVKCGNGWCEYPETESTCAQDCSIGNCTASQNTTYNVKPQYLSAFGNPGATVKCTGEQYCSLVVENPSPNDIIVNVKIDKVKTVATGEVDPSYNWVTLISATNDEVKETSMKLNVPGGSQIIPGQSIVLLKTDVPISIRDGTFEYNVYLTTPCLKKIVRVKTIVGQFDIFAFLEVLFGTLFFTAICLPNGVCFDSIWIFGIVLLLIILIYNFGIKKKRKKYER